MRVNPAPSMCCAIKTSGVFEQHPAEPSTLTISPWGRLGRDLRLFGRFAWLRLCANTAVGKEHWNRLLSKYLQERDQLKGLVLMVDIRRGLTELDVQMIQWFVPLA